MAEEGVARAGGAPTEIMEAPAGAAAGTMPGAGGAAAASETEAPAEPESASPAAGGSPLVPLEGGGYRAADHVTPTGLGVAERDRGQAPRAFAPATDWALVRQHVATGQIVRGTVSVVDEEAGQAWIDIGQAARVIVPFGELDRRPVTRPHSYVGREVFVALRAFDEARNLIVGSRRQALAAQVAATLPRLTAGSRHRAVVLSVQDWGALVDVGGVLGYLHVRDFSRGWTPSLRGQLQPGTALEVAIKSVDSERQTCDVSLAALLPDPWAEAAQRYRKNQRVLGVVRAVQRWGIFVELEPGLDGLAPIPYDERRRPEVGERVRCRVAGVDPERRRLPLRIEARLPAT